MEDPTDGGPNAEQKKWEEEHMKYAMMHFGAEDAKARQKVWIGRRGGGGEGLRSHLYRMANVSMNMLSVFR